MEDLRQARHNLRGRLNALKLCVSAFEVIDSPQEAVEFLDMIIAGTDKTVVALEAVETLLESQAPVPG
jgi:hypothetical protein